MFWLPPVGAVVRSIIIYSLRHKPEVQYLDLERHDKSAATPEHRRVVTMSKRQHFCET